MLLLERSAEALLSALAWVTHSRFLITPNTFVINGTDAFCWRKPCRNTVLLKQLHKVHHSVVLSALLRPGRRIFIIYSWRWIQSHDSSTAGEQITSLEISTFGDVQVAIELQN